MKVILKKIIEFLIFLIVVYFFTIIGLFILKKKEGFIWNKQATQDFLLIQNTINPNKIFDINLIQENQASQEELDYFNMNKKWPWSEKTKKLYIKAIEENPFVRISPKSSLDYAITVYNEKAILMILSYQTKEGQFLLNGVQIQNSFKELPSGFGDFPYFSGQIENNNDIIKCNMSKSNEAFLEKITFTKKGKQITPVDYNNLEQIIPGFTFLNGSCNPCVSINQNPNYSCPFKLKVKNKPFISDIWQTLWKI